MNAVDIYYKDIVEQESRKINNLKHIPGVVTEIVVPKNTGAAKVRIMGRTLRLLNKTGETLEVGDSVIVHYWDNMANGYIALRCGLPSLQQGLHIENAAVMHNNLESLYTTDTTVFNEDEENDLTEKYSHLNNLVMVDGNPAIYVPFQSTLTDFKTTVKTVDKKLFSNRIQANCRYYHGTYLHYSSLVGRRTICADIREMKYVDTSTLGYYLGCYIKEDINWRLFYGERQSYMDEHKVECEHIYFDDTQLLKDIGLIIAYQEIVSTATEDFPYGYVVGYPVIRCGINDDGYSDLTDPPTRCDMVWGVGRNNITLNTSMWFGFKDENELKYALTTTQRTELKVAR